MVNKYFLLTPLEMRFVHVSFPFTYEAQRNYRNSRTLKPLVGAIDSLQALEVIKIICSILTSSTEKLCLFERISLEW
ncbi:hypothetical protein [Candidatus Erwinia haradaeae]|uniref:hypothetical protein n=1 Tax=Candidatus Erwinia haradaeae TaxID=1922217 RepID=UPI001300A55D|nr:hypothetical protein [Candidatus Erwinia haradaeae]